MRPGVAVCLSVCAAAGLVCDVSLAGEVQVTRWVSAGDAGSVRISADGAVTLEANAAAAAGALSPAMPMPTGANAVLVQAEVSAAEPRSVTFSVHDLGGGETVGYWQNPLPIRDAETVALVLPLAQRPPRARLFAGTHDRPSHARVADVRWQPLRCGAVHRGAVWGVVVDGSRAAGQTFKATGDRLAAVAFRARELQGRAGLDLRVRLYRWTKDAAATRGTRPLAEATVPRHQIPPAEGHGIGERHIAVALAAPTIRDETYFVDLGPAGPCSEQQAILLYGGPDGYRDGCRYENDRPFADWDLYFETYYAAD